MQFNNVVPQHAPQNGTRPHAGEPGHVVMACVIEAITAPTGRGWVALIATPEGLVSCSLPRPTEDDAVSAMLPHVSRAQHRPLGPLANVADAERQVGDLLDETVRRLRGYFRGVHESFDLPVDWAGLSPFTRAVLDALRSIPYGQVRTYGEIARGLNRAGASRAVGQAVGANPLPVIVPCHRVVATSGLGGYTGGLEWKRRLLALEGIASE